MKMKLLNAFGLAALTPCALARAVPSLNLPITLAPIKAKLAANQQANIVVFGDSLSFRPGTYLDYFRTDMQGQYGNAGPGYQGWSFQTGGGFDPGWTRGLIDNDTTPHLSLDGLWASTANATTAFFTPTSSHIQLDYVAQPGGGTAQTFYYNTNNQAVDLGVTLNMSAATAQLKTWDYNVPSYVHDIWYRTLGDGTVTILGENNINDTPGVRIHRAANGGWGVNNFLQRDWTFDAQLPTFNPDLVMVWLGQNDQGFDETGYAAKIQQLVTRVQSDAPSAKIVLIGTYDQGSPPLAGLVAGMADVAAADGLGFINIFETAGNRAFFDSHGYLDDGVHFSPAGGQYLGNFLYHAFLTDGASLLPGDTNNDGLVDIKDLITLAIHWGQTGGGINYSTGDLNFDGVVDAADLTQLALHWQSGAANLEMESAALGLPSVPEPAMIIITSGAILLPRRRRMPK